MEEMFIIIIIIIINRCWRVYLIMSSSTTSRGCSPLSPSPPSLPPSVDTSSKSLRYLVGRKWVLINILLQKFSIYFSFIQNKILFRMDSILVNSEITKSLASQLLHSPQTTPQTTPLPDLRPSTAPELEYGRRKSAGAHTFIIITIFMALLPRLPDGHAHSTSHAISTLKSRDSIVLQDSGVVGPAPRERTRGRCQTARFYEHRQ